MGESGAGEDPTLSLEPTQTPGLLVRETIWAQLIDRQEHDELRLGLDRRRKTRAAGEEESRRRAEGQPSRQSLQ